MTLYAFTLSALFFAFCSRDWKNPYDDAGYNTPPTARVRMSHTSGTVDTLFIADASGSYDAEDSLSGLQFRWDWESDGVWDGDFSPSPVDSHRFSDGGVKAVKLAVMDRGGMGDTVIVTLGINAAPVARFRVTPRLNNFEYSVFVDAGASTDLEDDSTAFEYRWDFGNGGGWSGWSSAETLAYAYMIADKNAVHSRTVKLEVRDAGGAVGMADTVITVDFHPGMVLIPEGQFRMGSDFENDTVNNPFAGAGTFVRELPVHPVRVSSFWMDSIEVTQRDYLSLIGENPSATAGFGNPLMPVERVGWYEAVLYCNSRSKRDGLDTVYAYTGRSEYSVAGIPLQYTTLSGLTTDFNAVGYRLPTEAEWEYACRAGSAGLFSFGNDSLDADRYMWYVENSGIYPNQVAQKEPNGFGLYDMHGNLDEWCNDWYGEYAADTSLVTDPHGAAMPVIPADQRKILRGGGFESWYIMSRSSFRASQRPFVFDITNAIVGFRVVLPAR